MKIVAFSESIWPEGGGGELATHLVLKLLAASDDIDVEVYTGSPSPAPVPNAKVRVAGLPKSFERDIALSRCFGEQGATREAHREGKRCLRAPLVLLRRA